MRKDEGRILVVEDSEDLIELWRALFGRAGIRAVFCACGKEALALVREGLAPDILMTDYYLPDMTGADLILEVWKSRPGVKALVVTGNGNSDIRYSLPAGTGVLVKPVRFEQLKKKIESLKPRPEPPSGGPR